MFSVLFFYFIKHKTKTCGESTIAFLTCYYGLREYFFFFGFSYNTFLFFLFLFVFFLKIIFVDFIFLILSWLKITVTICGENTVAFLANYCRLLQCFFPHVFFCFFYIFFLKLSLSILFFKY